MRKTTKVLFVFNCFILINAQNVNSLKIDRESLHALTKEYRDIYSKTKNVVSELLASTEKNGDISAPVSTLLSDHNEKFSEDLTALRSSDEKAPLNVNWVSDVNYNASPGFSEDNIFYRMKASSGIDWVATGEGSAKGAKASLEIEKDRYALALHKNKEYKDHITLQKRRNEVQLIFARKKLDFLKLYENYLGLIQNFNQKQFHKGLINAADVSKSAFLAEKVRLQIEYLESQDRISALDQQFVDRFYSYNFPQLSPEASSQVLKKTSAEALALQKKIFEQQEKKEKQIDLRLKLRYNYYVTADRDRNFASVGASFTLPLSKSRLQSSHDMSLQLLEKDLQDEEVLLKEKMQTLLRDYYQNITEVKILESEKKYFESELKFKSTDESSDSFSPSGYLDFTHKLFENFLKTCELKANTFDLLLQYENYTQDKEPNAPKVMRNSVQENAGHETYIWTSFFNNYSNTYIINLMNHWNINKIFLSAGPSINAIKLENFKTEAALNNIAVHRLIGENSYAASDNGYPDLEQKLIAAKDMGFTGIHLDIEPHTFSDYKDNIPLYTQRLITLFTNSQNWCNQNNIELSVSVPMQLPTDVAYALKNNNTKTYIMAYDVLSLEKKLNKTLVMRDILGSSLYTWVFRINDFANYSDLLDAETTVSTQGVGNIGYYDLSQMDNFKP